MFETIKAKSAKQWIIVFAMLLMGYTITSFSVEVVAWYERNLI